MKNFHKPLRRNIQRGLNYSQLESRNLLASLYVSPSGDDGNAGTIEAPFETVNHALGLAQPGDNILLRGGTYRETVSTVRSGTSEQPISIENYNGEEAFISASDVVDGTWTETSSGSGIYFAEVAGTLPSLFWDTNSESANGTRSTESGGNFSAVVVNEASRRTTRARSIQATSELNFFAQPVSMKVRGLSIESTGTTDLPLTATSGRFSFASEQLGGFGSDDSVNVQFKGDGRLELRLKKDTASSWGTNVGSVTDLSITGFDLTLQPGTIGNIDYSLVAFPSGVTVASGSWEMAQSDWSDGGDGSTSSVEIHAQEGFTDTIDVTQQFEMLVDSIELTTGSTVVLNDEFDDGDIATATYFPSGRTTTITSGYDQVFVDGEMQQEARYSNKLSGDLLESEAASLVMNDDYSLTGSEFDGNPDDFFAGSRFLGRVGQGWSWQTAIATGSAGDTVTLDSDTASTWWWPNFRGRSTDSGIGYFYGKLDFLDADREWYLEQNNSGNDVLYLRTENGADPTGHVVEKKTRNWTVNIDGHDNIVIRGLNLRGGAIRIDGSNNVFENNDARYLSHYLTFDFGSRINGGFESGSGILVGGSNNVIRGNEIYDTAGSGIVADGSDHLITRNSIYNTDYSGTYGAGLVLNGTGHTATFNSIHDSGRDILRPTGSGLTVMYNDLFRAGRMALDVGVIYTWGKDGLDANGNKSRIAYNWVHENGNPADPISKGIYLDNFTRNFIVDHNVIWDLGSNSSTQSGIKLNSPTDNVEVYNNTLIFAPAYNLRTWTNFPTTNANPDYWNSSTHRMDYVGQNNLIVLSGADLNAYFEDFDSQDFRPLAGSNAVDPATSTGVVEWTTTDGSTNVPSGFTLSMSTRNQLFGYREVTGEGVVVPGISDEFNGQTPDNGAYESGVPLWKAGSDGYAAARIEIIFEETTLDENGTLIGTVQRNTSDSDPLTIHLFSSDTSEATLPSSVTIPGGQDFATFTVEGVNDIASDGNQTITISASAFDHVDGTMELDVMDIGVASIVSRGVSYKNATASYGQFEIDPTKQPLLPGQTAEFSNYTSYSRGINRVAIEVNGLAATSLTADDFEFRVGNTDTPSDWLLLTSTTSIALPTINLAPMNGGTSIVELTWSDNVIENNWLQINLLSNESTNVPATDTFYFGNQIGETGNVVGNTSVNLADVALTRINQTGFGSATIDNVYDFNRDGRVNLVDVGLARINQSGFSSLVLFTAPENSQGRNGRSKPGSGEDTNDDRNQRKLIWHPIDSWEDDKSKNSAWLGFTDLFRLRNNHERRLY